VGGVQGGSHGDPSGMQPQSCVLTVTPPHEGLPFLFSIDPAEVEYSVQSTQQPAVRSQT
jgi:hypothetical protein